MSNSNILSPVINAGFDAGKFALRSLYKLLNIKEQYSLDNYYKAVNLKNGAGEFPRTLKISENDKTIDYVITVPRGLTIDDFKKCIKGLELQLSKDVIVSKAKSKGAVIVSIHKQKLEQDFNFKRFFMDVDLKNKSNNYPVLISKNETANTISYKFKVPAGITLADFKAMQDSLELQINKDVKISILKGCIEVLIYKVMLSIKIDYEKPYRVKESLFIPIGESIGGEVQYLDMKEHCHSYIVGQTGSGKSVCTKVLLTSLITIYSADEVELYLADLKRVELNLFSKVEHCKRFVYTVADTTHLIAELLEETNRRYDLFMKHNVTSIFEYNKLKGVKKLKYQVLFVEEMTLLLEDSKKKAQKLLKQLMAISRASGLYVICTTQRPSSDIIDNVIKSLITNRIVFKVEDTKNSIICLDDEGAEKLRGNGHLLYKAGSTITECQSYFITDNQVKQIISPYQKKEVKSEPARATVNNVSDTLVKKQKEKAVNVNYETRGTSKKAGNMNKSKVIDDLSFLDNL